MKYRNSRVLTFPGPAAVGFTLVELVVVIVILSITALLVYPKLTATGESGLRSSARSLSAAIRYVEDRAVSAKSSYRMKINLGDSNIQILKIMADGDEQPAGDVIPGRPLIAEGISITDVILPRLGKVTEGEARIDFGPLGLGSMATIHLCSRNGRYYTVQAYPRSGRVRVFDNYSGAAI